MEKVNSVPYTEVTYVRFEPCDKCFKVNRFVLLLCLMGFGLLSHYVLADEYELLRTVVLVLVWVAAFVLFVTKFGYRPLYGQLKGEITFGIDKISVDAKHFPLETISLIDIHLVDYYGKQVSTMGSIDRLFSRGAGNYVQFTTSSGEEYLFYFQFKDERDYKRLEPIADEYFRQGKITFNNRYQIQRTDLFA